VSSIKDIRQQVRKLCLDENYDPLREMIILAKDPSTPLDHRVTLHKELSQYVAPKLKAMELTAEVSGGIQVNVLKFADMAVKEAIKEASADDEDEDEPKALVNVGN
jgi:hypothetical protein